MIAVTHPSSRATQPVGLAAVVAPLDARKAPPFSLMVEQPAGAAGNLRPINLLPEVPWTAEDFA